MQNAIEKIIESHGLTVQEFCSYQRAYPQMRAEIHSATLEIFEKINGMNVMQLSKWIKSRGYKGDRDKVRRMLAGLDIDQAPFHYSTYEMHLLNKLAPKMTFRELAVKLGRTESGVRSMITKVRNDIKRAKFKTA